jgi:hypothetical protein
VALRSLWNTVAQAAEASCGKWISDLQSAAMSNASLARSFCSSLLRDFPGKWCITPVERVLIKKFRAINDNEKPLSDGIPY